MRTNYTISEDLQYELQRFVNNHEIVLLNQNLRRMLVDFLDYELRTGVRVYFDGFFYAFNNLLDVLDTAGKELHQHAISEKLDEELKMQASTTKEKVIAFLVASLSPSAIFLLHHNADNNNKQHFDLLAIIPATSKTSFTYYEQVITMANIEDAVISVSLHKEDMLQQQLIQGHMYYSIACNKETLVYSSNDFEFPQLNHEALKSLAHKATGEFNAAHKKAGNFLHGAANFRTDKDNELTAFMLQQAAELIIRAYLESRYSSRLTITNADIDLLSEAVELLHRKAGILFKERIASLMESS